MMGQLLFVLAFFITLASQAEDLLDMSLEELMGIKVSVASKAPLTARESPGIVTLITSEQIKKSGARDVIDILNTVPGIHFAVDVQNSIGMGVRGLWATEGKVLVLWDGIEMNELMFGTTQFGGHFPISQIKQIEIIRGPGSALYGGFAELAVINIISKGLDHKPGEKAWDVTADLGQFKSTYERRTLSANYGGKTGTWNYSAGLYFGELNRSDQDFTDFYNNSYNMAENAKLSPMFANFGLTNEVFSLRLLYDRFAFMNRDQFSKNLPEAIPTYTETYAGIITYNFRLSQDLNLTPKFSYKKQRPYLATTDKAKEFNATYGVVAYDREATRLLAGLELNYNSEGLKTSLGVESTADDANTHNSGPLYEDVHRVSYQNQAVYGQVALDSSLGEFTAGARNESHSAFGSSFVPRLAFVKVWEPMHLKLLYSKAFRAPSIENIAKNKTLGLLPIKPEQTTAYEVEVGYRLNSANLITMNFFDVKIDQPIVYFVDPNTTLEGYNNFDRTGSVGVEIEYKFLKDVNSLTASYAYYTANGKNNVDLYSVPDRKNELLAFATQRAAVRASYSLIPNLSLNPTITYIGERYGYGLPGDGAGIGTLQKFSALSVFDLYLFQENLFTSGLNVGVGVFNLTDAKLQFIQPYNSQHAPLPDRSREVMARVNYTLLL